MKKQEIEASAQKIVASINNGMEKNDSQTIIQQLTFLSHCNINILNQYIASFSVGQKIIDEKFQLEITLFESEQKLNEQKIEEAAQLINSVLEKSIHIQYKKVEVLALLQKAVLNLYLDKKEEVIEIFNQSEQFALIENNFSLLIEVYIYGYHFYSETDTHKAGEYIYRALDLAKQHGNIYKQAYALMHLGTLNTILSNNDAALNFFEESFALFKQLQLNISMADNLMCQFNIYYRKKEFDIAIKCLQQAIDLAENCGWEHKIAICYGNLSTVYLQLSKFEEAKQAAEKDIELSYQLNSIYNVGIATYRLGRIEAALGNSEKAIELLNESIKLRKNRISNNQLVQVYHHLLNLYAKTGDYKNAFEIQSKHTQLKFEILNTEKAKESEALREKYEAEKRETELKESRLQHTESELKALKAQMNPHFIFNALNSIQEVFFLGDKRLANKHLSRFSNLMRSILSASSKKQITLEEEIAMLQEYLALEQLRFGNTFQFHVSVANDVDIYTIEVPPMIIQPFVENAIKHGLMHKEGEQNVTITFSIINIEVLGIAITDNGIGRKASAILNQHRKNHESFSTHATQKRFDMLNQFSQQKFSFEYEDLEDNKGNASGTKVMISLPVEA